MCFSATASFTAAAVLGATGAFTLGRSIVQKRPIGERTLASFPVFFALQQAGEGMVWLGIYGTLPAFLEPIAMGLFIFAAYVFWPVMGPVTGWLLEPPGPRKRMFVALILGGLIIASYLSFAALSKPQTPIAMEQWGGHIWYMHDFTYIPYIETLYFLTACTALLLSSNRVAFWFAVVLTGAFAITMWGYNINVVPSVWCFYAAGASLVIVVGLLDRERMPAES
ncbi:MAG: DUF6629 family protein [Pseudomonadota bacterium]